MQDLLNNESKRLALQSELVSVESEYSEAIADLVADLRRETSAHEHAEHKACCGFSTLAYWQTSKP